MIHQDNFTIQTRGRGTYEVTDNVQQIIHAAQIDTGLCHVFVHHTSASLILCENADPTVRHDLESFMVKVAPDGDPMYRHPLEGPDDMSAHIRSVITSSGLTIPISGRRCSLGTWQGIYLWEHRTSGHRRKLTVTIQGG